MNFLLLSLIFFVINATAAIDNAASVYSDYECIGYSPDTRSCLFKNICFVGQNRSWLFYHEPGITALPYETFVRPNGKVNSELIFDKSWRVDLAVSYAHVRSKYEASSAVAIFKAPSVVSGAIPKETFNWIESPLFLFARTEHDDNIGHLVMDNWHPLLTAIKTHLLDIRNSKSVVTLDLAWRAHVFSRYNGKYDKWWRIHIGDKLFKSQLDMRSFYQGSKKLEKQNCYKKVIVGCGKLSGLEGQVLHRSDSISYIREVLWNEYAPQRTNEYYSDSDTLQILMLEKNFSQWTHMNIVKNWNSIVTAVAAFPKVNVVNIAPQNTNFSQQVQLYRNADIIISLWGGISMLNFLMPPGGVEVLITSWYGELMPLPNNSDHRTLACPDFDDRARMSISGASKSLRYCTRDDGYASNTIDLTDFMPLVEKAIRYRRWKKKTSIISS